MTRIFFSTDVHGSEVCFRKFLNALKIYKADVGILLGDLTGKMITPIIKQEDGSYLCEYVGHKKIVRTEEELRELEKNISLIGNYYFYTTPKEFEELKSEGKTIDGRIDERSRKIHLGKGKIEGLFKRLSAERLANWIALAEEKLKGSHIKMFMAPGNDDDMEISKILDSSTFVVNADGRKVEFDGYEMITLSWSNPTPWDTPRECSEEELCKKIENLVSKIENMEKAIFNFHAPPYGTVLDLAPKLSENLVPSASELVNVGSTAVLDAIKTHQPLLSLHGHIHESKGAQKIGRTICINPGSEYTEGILCGVIINLDKGKVKNYLFTAG